MIIIVVDLKETKAYWKRVQVTGAIHFSLQNLIYNRVSVMN